MDSTRIHPAAAPRRTASGRARPLPAAVALGLSALLTLLVVAFAWPAARTAPRNLPLALVAPPAVAAQAEHQLQQAHPGAFTLTQETSVAAAERAIRQRQVYGAVVLAPRPTVLVASSASPVVAQLLQQVAAAQGPAAGPPVRDVVPLPAGDPHGAVLIAGALPVVIGSIITALVLCLRFPGRGSRLGGAVTVAMLGGLGVTATLQGWLGALDGSFLANWGVVGLGILAIVSVPLGLYHLAGRAGLGAGVAAVVLLGVPLSGITSAPELLPAGWSELGRLLPVGALGNAVRSTAFFDGHGALAPVLVLVGWALAGAVCVAVGQRRWASASLATPSR